MGHSKTWDMVCRSALGAGAADRGNVPVSARGEGQPVGAGRGNVPVWVRDEGQPVQPEQQTDIPATLSKLFLISSSNTPLLHCHACIEQTARHASDQKDPILLHYFMIQMCEFYDDFMRSAEAKLFSYDA